MTNILESLGLSQVSLDDPRYILHSDQRQQFCRNAEGKIMGINLSNTELGNAQAQALMEEELSALEYVNLRGNKSLNRLAFPKAMPALKRIDASDCGLEKVLLPEDAPELVQIELQKNQLKEIKISDSFQKLSYLDLSNNELGELFLAKGFAQLQYLYLNDNQLKRLDIESLLPELKTLHLRNNALEKLPDNFLSFHKLEALYLYKNPLSEIPKEVISEEERGNSLEGVRNYLQSTRDFDTNPLYEAKLLLVGNGEVGKTSIRIRLKSKTAPLPKKEERTQGLDIESYEIPQLSTSLTGLEQDIDFQFNIWDFGGQGKYREVQQLFCSRKSLYLFVTAYDDDPKDEDYIGFEYWMDMVNAYSYDEGSKHLSPIIHVVNKIDKETKRINEEERCELFPNIFDFIKISCLQAKTIDKLKESLQKVIPKLSPDIFTVQYAAPWLEVKEVLQARQKENHISYADYEALCLKHKMSKSDAKTWLETLSRIGTVIYFGQDEKLKDWIILNPKWIKHIMYQLIDSPLSKKGVIAADKDIYEFIWPAYSAEDHEKFWVMMQAYDFAYLKEDASANKEYVVPACLPREKPQKMSLDLQLPTFQLKLTYNPFVPAGTINKLIVGLQKNNKLGEMRTHEVEKGREKLTPSASQLHLRYMWKNNVVIEESERRTYAHIRESWQDKAVHVDIFGENAALLFAYIQEILKRINQKIRDTKYLDELDIEVLAWYKGEWEKLEKLEKNFGIDFFSPESSDSRALNLYERRKELVIQNQVKEALTSLEEYCDHDAIKEEATLLLSRLNGVESEERKGLLSGEDARLEKKKIVAYTLQLIEKDAASKD